MIKRLSKCIGEYKLSAIFTPIIVSLEVIMECIIPFITAELINIIQIGEDGGPSSVKMFLGLCITEANKLNGIFYDGILLLILAMLSLTAGALAGKLCAIASCGFAKNLRGELYNKVQEFSFENIDKFSTSSLVTRLTTDVTNVQQSFMMLIRMAIRCPFMFIFSLIMSFIIGGYIALIFVAVIPILIFGLYAIAKKVLPIFKKVFQKYDNLNNSVQENVKGMRVVKSYVREDYEKQKFDIAAKDVQVDFTRAEKILALNMPLMQFCMYTVTILICIVSAHVLINATSLSFNIGKLSSLLTYGIQILSSLMMVSMVLIMMTMSVESARRICEVLDEKTTLDNPQNPIFEIKNGDIDFENVNFKYAKRAEKYALQNIDLHIKSGQTVGILGGTGSSKSSLVQLIPRLYDVTSGSVKVGGVDVRDYDIEALRNDVSVVLQKNILFSGTIKENLRWGNENATDEEMEKACTLAQADEFIKSFPQGYDTYIEQGGSNVSGGQKQRLCIARALLKKPKVLILDDSTSAVDTKTDALIRKAFKEEIPNTTKIIIAQRISSIENADIIIVLEDGKINGMGTHSELLNSNEIYKDIYKSQTKGVKMA